MPNEKAFTTEEVRKLVTNAYEVGFADGVDSTMTVAGGRATEYRNAADFWKRNSGRWLEGEINYVG